MSAPKPDILVFQEALIAMSAQPKPSEVMATWSISLDTECPKCGHDFDLLAELSANSTGIEPIEYGTPRTNNYETSCPECRHEFEVCFEY